ncbi:MAG: ATP-binding protein [Acidobacteriota bacterium]|nr:ATP-binding protein [Acidobacteriota bacterium]
MKYISLFPPERSAAVGDFVKKHVSRHVYNTYTHVLFAPSVQEAEILFRGGEKLSLLSQRRPHADTRNEIQEVSISGYENEEQASEILNALLTDRFRGGVGASLHVHLARYAPLPEVENGNADDEQSTKELFELVEPRVSMDDLILPQRVKDKILRNLLVIKNRAILFDEWRLRDIPGFRNKLTLSLNFIGPSGTGKTFAAEAVAHALRKPLMVVDYSSLESKYVGDTSKNIKTVFSAASEHDALLFFDEADSFLGRRIEDVRHSYDNAVNNTRAVMLMELNGFGGVIIFATNLASNYDPAFRRRILDHIEFPLPDTEARIAILKNHTPAGLPGREGLDFGLIASRARGLSGSDLANVVYKSCITLLSRIDRDAPGSVITNEDYLEAVKELRRSRHLIRESYRPNLFAEEEEAEGDSHSE